MTLEDSRHTQSSSLGVYLGQYAWCVNHVVPVNHLESVRLACEEIACDSLDVPLSCTTRQRIFHSDDFVGYLDSIYTMV